MGKLGQPEHPDVVSTIENALATIVAHGKSAGIEQSIPADPEELLRPGGTIVIDDLTPASTWPPRFGGQVDQGRMHWLTHSALDAAELRLAPDLAALVATRRFPAS